MHSMAFTKMTSLVKVLELSVKKACICIAKSISHVILTMTLFP